MGLVGKSYCAGEIEAGESSENKGEAALQTQEAAEGRAGGAHPLSPWEECGGTAVPPSWSPWRIHSGAGGVQGGCVLVERPHCRQGPGRTCGLLKKASHAGAVCWQGL